MKMEHRIVLWGSWISLALLCGLAVAWAVTGRENALGEGAAALIFLALQFERARWQLAESER